MFHFSFASLRVRLMILVLLGVIPALGLILYTGVLQRRLVTRLVQNDALRVAHLVAMEENELVDSTRQTLLAMAAHPEVINGDYAKARLLMQKIAREHPVFANLGIADRSGRITCSLVPLKQPVSVADRHYFQYALKERAFSMGEFQVGRITGRPTINFGYPILDSKENPVGVVFAAVDLNWLNHFAARIKLPRGSNVVVIENNGIVLVRQPDNEHVAGKNMSHMPIVKAVLARGEGTEEQVGLDGIKRLYSFTTMTNPAGPSTLYLLIGIPAKPALVEVDRTTFRNLLGLSVAAALALLAAWFGGDAFILRRVRALLRATRRIQAGDLTARTGVSHSRGELNQLAMSFDQMAVSLERRVAEREKAERELMLLNRDLEKRVRERAQELVEKNHQMEDELDLARDLQRAFLPQQHPIHFYPVGDKSTSLRIYHRYCPTGTVGGDFFDVIPISDTKAGIFICDVMGRGVRAALVTAIVRGLVEELKPIAGDAGRFLTEINRGMLGILRQTDTYMFATAFYLVADITGGRIHFANAGHPSPLHLRQNLGVVEALRPVDETSEPALGLVEEFAYPTRHGSLAAGDLIMLFTDGLFEVDGPNEEEYGPGRLLAAVRQRISLPPAKLLDELLAEVQEFSVTSEFMDDVCLVGMEVARTGVVAVNGKKAA